MPLYTDYTNMMGGDKSKWSPIVYNEIKEDGETTYELTGIAQVMVLCCHIYSVWEITQDNWKECFIRLDMWQNGMGTLLYDRENKKEILITPEMVYEWIGFKVNCGEESKAKYRKRLTDAMRSRAVDKLKDWEKQRGDK
tara:strand:+ start:68 stop:484 length:417 start_codon:yes stop_codon:yes gene_type:complete